MSVQLVRYPWIWLYRFRHRRGYGIHSPWAYSFVRDVILETTPFYAYSRLATCHPWRERWLFRYRLTCCRLLFRLANYADGRHFDIYATTGEDVTPERTYISSAKASMAVSDRDGGSVPDFVLVKSSFLPRYELQPCKMLVLEGIHRNKENRQRWIAIKADPRTGCTFDVYTYGIVFFDLTLHKQHYIIDF